MKTDIDNIHNVISHVVKNLQKISRFRLSFFYVKNKITKNVVRLSI